MTDTRFGPEIRTDRQRPEWIRDDELLAYLHTDVGGWIENTRPSAWMDPRDGFRLIEAIRLPHDHAYYVVQRHNQEHGTDFVYWPGGSEAPADWDHEEVLTFDKTSTTRPLRVMRITVPDCWKIKTAPYVKVIGYRCKVDDQYGDPVKIDGVRPDWLNDGELAVVCISHSGREYVAFAAANITNWSSQEAIRLPHDHPYYLATSKGFTYWPGGESAPDDIDRNQPILLRNGSLLDFDEIRRWQHWASARSDVVGYHKRALEDDDDIVQIKRMTRVEFVTEHNPNESAWTLAVRLGLIRPESQRYVKVEDVEEAHRRLFEGGNLSLSSLDAALRQLPVKELSDA